MDDRHPDLRLPGAPAAADRLITGAAVRCGCGALLSEARWLGREPETVILPDACPACQRAARRAAVAVPALRPDEV